MTVEDLWREIDILQRKGRRGVAELRTVLVQRGMVEAPAPSVLESFTLRLLRSWGIEPISIERVVYRDGRRYRLDFMLLVNLALEVDGFAYHSSPEAKARDAKRRSEIRLGGIEVIEADWVTVMRRPAELKRTLLAWLRRLQVHTGQQPETRR